MARSLAAQQLAAYALRHQLDVVEAYVSVSGHYRARARTLDGKQVRLYYDRSQRVSGGRVRGWRNTTQEHTRAAKREGRA